MSKDTVSPSPREFLRQAGRDHGSAGATLEVDVKHLLRDRLNELVVRVTSGMELAPDASGERFPTEQRRPLYAVRSFVHPRHRFLRKPAHNAYGWDWCDPLPNVGIWRGVRLEGRADVVVHHLKVDTRIRNGAACLEGEVILENLEARSEVPCVLSHRYPLSAVLPIGARG